MPNRYGLTSGEQGRSMGLRQFILTKTLRFYDNSQHVQETQGRQKHGTYTVESRRPETWQ